MTNARKLGFFHDKTLSRKGGLDTVSETAAPNPSRQVLAQRVDGARRVVEIMLLSIIFCPERASHRFR